MYPLKVSRTSTSTREASIWGIIFQVKKLSKISSIGKNSFFPVSYWKKHFLKPSAFFSPAGSVSPL